MQHNVCIALFFIILFSLYLIFFDLSNDFNLYISISIAKLKKTDDRSMTKCHIQNKKTLSLVVKHDKIDNKKIFENLAHNLMLCIY
jgi:hypothetical protein